MQAWQFENFGLANLRQVSLPQPEMDDNDVVISVHAVSLNYRDKMWAEGTFRDGIKMPLIPACDAVGEVIKAGNKVSRFQAGERVMTTYNTTWIDGDPKGDEPFHSRGHTLPGVLSEQITANEETLVKVPEYLQDEEAATLPCAALTAWFALVEKGNLKAKQTVVAQGTGGVSIFATQIAHAMGARVIITSSSDEKLERVKALGADAGVNYSRHPNWGKEVLGLTDGVGADHIIEVVGGENLNQSLEAAKAGGHIAIIGFLKAAAAEVPFFQVMLKQLNLRGYVVGSRASLERMNRAFEDWKLRPVIDRVYGFNEVVEAYKHLYRGAFGKIVVKVKD